MIRSLMRLIAFLGAVAALTALYVRWLHVTNPTIVSLSFLLIVLLAAATSRLWIAVATSVTAMLVVNFFFLPPVGTSSPSPICELSRSPCSSPSV